MLSFLASLPGSNDMQDVANSGVVQKLHGLSSALVKKKSVDFTPAPKMKQLKHPVVSHCMK